MGLVFRGEGLSTTQRVSFKGERAIEDTMGLVVRGGSYERHDGSRFSGGGEL